MANPMRKDIRTLSSAVAAGLLVAASMAQAGGELVVFEDRQELVDAAAAMLPAGAVPLQLEDFSEGFVRFLPQMEFAACTEPVSSRSNDACFAPGGLVEGFSLGSSHRFGIIMLGSDLLGTTDPVIGGWPYRINPSSLNYTRIGFSGGPVLFGVDVYGFRIAGGSATGESAPVLVEAFDTDGDLVGEFTVTPASHNQPAFAGFFSPRPLGTVQVGTREQAAGTMIAMLQFGGSAGRLQPQPASLDLGAVALGGSASATVEFRNTGVLDVGIASVQPLPAPFSIAADGCTGQVLASDQACAITVAFSPAYAGGFEAGVQLIDAGGAAASVAVRAGGVAAGGGQ